MMVKLFIDAGNTRIKWQFTGGAMQSATHVQFTQVASSWMHLPAPQAIIVSCVSPVHSLIERACQHWSCPIKWFSVEDGVGLQRHYSETLGVDRWAALLAARHIAPQTRVLVANAGTALTLDVLVGQSFIGGLICAGRQRMLDSLSQGTQLPHISAVGQLQLGQTTPSALSNACAYMMLGATTQVCEAQHIQAIVFSGGDASWLYGLKEWALPTQVVDDLVIKGLMLA